MLREVRFTAGNSANELCKLVQESYAGCRIAINELPGGIAVRFPNNEGDVMAPLESRFDIVNSPLGVVTLTHGPIVVHPRDGDRIYNFLYGFSYFVTPFQSSCCVGVSIHFFDWR
jgi:hypothetical protein